MSDEREEAAREREQRQQMTFFLGHAPGDTYARPTGLSKAARAVVFGKLLEQTRRYMRGR